MVSDFRYIFYLFGVGVRGKYLIRRLFKVIRNDEILLMILLTNFQDTSYIICKWMEYTFKYFLTIIKKDILFSKNFKHFFKIRLLKFKVLNILFILKIIWTAINNLLKMCYLFLDIFYLTKCEFTLSWGWGWGW